MVFFLLYQIMIPGRYECHGQGWMREYSGYLMSSLYSDKGKVGLVCVDQAPETDVKGVDNKDHAKLYAVDSGCGALPCPPYVHDASVNCVVCTK